MKATKTAVLLTVGALLAPAVAQGHVSLHPNTIPAGAFVTLNVRVPGERQGAYVRKVDMLLPSGFTSASYESVPGWKVTLVHRKLTKPVQTDDGPVGEAVSRIIWSWTGPLGQVRDGRFIDFPLAVAIPDDARGQSLQFKTLQTYSDGQVVRWIATSLSAEHPAPTVNVTAPGGPIEDVAGEEAGPAPNQAADQSATSPSTGGSAGAQASEGASKGLGVAALILGALGLLVGLGALLAARRARAAA
jgi:periplasmic copper chaperone A